MDGNAADLLATTTMKIAVVMAHTGTVKAATTRCLGAMMFRTGAADIHYGDGRPAKPRIELIFAESGPLEWKRTQLALRALDWGSDYLLWIDSDQIFPNDGLLQLMTRDKPIVAGNYQSRNGGEPTALDFEGKPVPRRSGVEEVGAVGFGFCLMKTPILHQIPQPWFFTKIGPDGDCVLGEDVHFCNQARGAGVKVFIDHDLDIGHIAERILTLDPANVNADAALRGSQPG